MDQKVAFGGGCHWCTEAVFQSLNGVRCVDQGFVASTGENNSFSEAVIVHFNVKWITLRELIDIHLHTHSSTSDHGMRKKYRSAVYTFSDQQTKEVKHIINAFQKKFNNKLITGVFPFQSFRPSDEQFKNYYFNDPEKPFCKRYIIPKLQIVTAKYQSKVKASCKVL